MSWWFRLRWSFWVWLSAFSANERMARKARIEEANPMPLSQSIIEGIAETRIRAYLLGRQHERQLAAIPEPLPKVCPACGRAPARWRHDPALSRGLSGWFCQLGPWHLTVYWER